MRIVLRVWRLDANSTKVAQITKKKFLVEAHPQCRPP